MATSSKRRRMVVLGTMVVALGVVAAIALWVAGGVRRTNAIDNFARAPIGCDTTLDFADTGTYILFVETTGRLDEVRGDCAAPREYDVEDIRPAVSITMIDPDGEQLELRDVSNSVTYSTDGYVGRSELEVEIAEAADHVIRVETSEDASFAVAVGRNPDDGVALLRGGAVALGLTAVVAGLAMALAGGRERDRPPSEWTPAQPGPPNWGGTPGFVPTQPPYRQPPPPPVSMGPGVAGPPTPGRSPVPPASPGFPAQAPPAAPIPPGSSFPGDRPRGDESIEATRSNPFAPPSGTPTGAPAGTSIPGQPPFGGTARSEETTDDGSAVDGWAAWGDRGTVPTDDDVPTPSHGLSRVDADAARPQESPPDAHPDGSIVDRWNTSQGSSSDAES